MGDLAPSPPLGAIHISEDLAPLPEMKTAGDTDVTFDGQLDRPLRLREDLRTGCGGQTWPAGMVLGKHMLRYHRHELQDARMLPAAGSQSLHEAIVENQWQDADPVVWARRLELGAGGGLVGLAVALGCGVASRLMLTDQLEMLELMKHNITLNQVDDKATASILNWGEPLPQDVVDYKPNVILAGECVYFEPAFPLLMQTLRDLIALCPDAVVYFCFKKRRRADMHFVKMARKAFTVDEVFDDDRPLFSRQSLFLFTFRAKHTNSKQQTKKPAGEEAAAPAS